MSTAQAQQTVETATVSGRRTLHYRDFDELLADAERLQAGGYRRLGNWPLGKMAKHLAVGFETGLDGAKFKVPFFFRIAAKALFKKSALRQMKPGFKLSAKAATHLVPGDISDAEGVDALRAVIHRWKTQSNRQPHPFFGELTNQEWDRLMLNHADMHMSFLLPKD